MSLVLGNEVCKSAVSAWDRAIGPRLVLRLARYRIGAGVVQPGHRMGDRVEEGDVVVQHEGASPVVVGSYHNRHLLVAGDRVDAGARCPMETGIRLKRHRVQVY